MEFEKFRRKGAIYAAEYNGESHELIHKIGDRAFLLSDLQAEKFTEIFHGDWIVKYQDYGVGIEKFKVVPRCDFVMSWEPCDKMQRYAREVIFDPNA